MPDSYSCTPWSVPLVILKLLKAESELPKLLECVLDIQHR